MQTIMDFNAKQARKRAAAGEPPLAPPPQQPPPPPPQADSAGGGGPRAAQHSVEDAAAERRRKRKSRWGGEDASAKTFIPGMPTIMPAGLTKEQEEAYLREFALIYDPFRAEAIVEMHYCRAHA